MENTTLNQTMKNSIPKLLEYVQEFEQEQKPLGEKAEAKCRAKVHTYLAEFVSWMTIKGIEWTENKTDLKITAQEIEKSVNNFGPKFFSLLQESVDKWQKALARRGKHETASRIPNTMLNATKKVLKSDLAPAIDFATEKHVSNQKEQKTVLSA